MTTATSTKQQPAATEQTTSQAAQPTPLQQASLPANQGDTRQTAQQELKRTTTEELVASIRQREKMFTDGSILTATPQVKADWWLEGRDSPVIPSVTVNQNGEQLSSQVADDQRVPVRHHDHGQKPKLRQDVATAFDKVFEHLDPPKIIETKEAPDGGVGTSLIIEDKDKKYAENLLKGQNSIHLHGFTIEKHVYDRQTKKVPSIIMTYEPETEQKPSPMKARNLSEIEDDALRAGVANTGLKQHELKKVNINDVVRTPFEEHRGAWLRADVAEKFDKLFEGLLTPKPKILGVEHVEGGGAGTVIVVEDRFGFYKNLTKKGGEDFKITWSDNKVRIEYIKKDPFTTVKLESNDGWNPFNKKTFDVQRQVGARFNELFEGLDKPKIMKVEPGKEDGKGTAIHVEDANKKYIEALLQGKKENKGTYLGFEISYEKTSENKDGLKLVYTGAEATKTPPNQQATKPEVKKEEKKKEEQSGYGADTWYKKLLKLE